MLEDHVAKYIFLYIHLHELSPVLISSKGMSNVTSMAECKTAVSLFLTRWSYSSLILSHRHVRGNVRNLKTGHCQVKCNVPTL